MQDPWYKSTFNYSALGSNLKIKIPHDVFSTQRIDEGTLLLLDHLPISEPKTILDMGCGYGALGLPIAAKFPHAQVEMVDRDLLAADWSGENARENQLSNVNAHGSLGFRNIQNSQYDWILCNVPARIGDPFIKDLIETGRFLLNDGGELRVVVITDLGAVLHRMKEEFKWDLKEVIQGPRHTIFSIGKSQKRPSPLDVRSLYLRDQVTIADLTLERPYDLGGDDQKRVKTGLPVLIDTLPRKLDSAIRVLCFRCGYGTLPLLSLSRWPKAKVIAVDRDLLGTTFTKMNAETLGLDLSRIEIRESSHFPKVIHEEEKFDLILGELSPSAGEFVALSEMKAIENALSADGQALILCLEKLEKDWVKRFASRSSIVLHKVLSREGYTVVRFSRP